jgi:hypothetical protein
LIVEVRILSGASLDVAAFLASFEKLARTRLAETMSRWPL